MKTKTLLLIKTSLFAEGGQSGALADRYAAAWLAANPGGKLIVRDVAREPVPHLDGHRFGALLSKPDERTPEQQRVIDDSDALIDELRRADEIVIGLPMYNFGVPSTLKAYFDHVARAGVTFRYTERGPVGLLADRRVTIFATRGGVHAATPSDTQTAFVRQFLAFLGLRRVEFVYAEGLAISEASRSESLAGAHAAIEKQFEELDPVTA